MRCRDAKEWLGAGRDGGPTSENSQELEEHLQQCSACRAFERHLRLLETFLSTPTPYVQTSLTTERIMLAVQQQRRITQQLEDIRKQQRTRIERMRSIGAASLALGFFTLSSIPLLLLAMIILQTDLVVKALYLLDGVIGVCIIIAQYLQVGLTMVTRNNLLLSGMAFAVVIMMGMWLRLMRHPQEA